VLERNFDPSPAQHPEMPRLDRETSTLQAVTTQISTDREELLASEHVAALQPGALADARLPLEQRLARIDRAIAAHVDDAVASPAPYLTSALGPRPSDPAQRDRWNTAARHIETWRQAELGLGPSAGELADDGLAAAIGAPPEDPALSLRHDLVVRNLPVEFQPTRTVERSLGGPALSLD
ncbi:MAG: hypothetical protein ABR540_14240, partial [Acidimicrobiales bacterium]